MEPIVGQIHTQNASVGQTVAENEALPTKYLVDFADLNSPLPWPLMLVSDAGVILHVNLCCAELLHRPADSLRGQPLSSLFAPGISLTATKIATVELLSADGRDGHPMRIYSIPITLENGQPIVLLGMYDCSRDEEYMQSQLRNAELEGITHTVAALNHGINNPLFGMMATVQMLRHELPDASASVLKKLDRMMECCERISQITEQLADIKRLARRTYAAEELMLDLEPHLVPEEKTTGKPEMK